MAAGFWAADLPSYCCASAVAACINSASVTSAAGAGVAVALTSRAGRARVSNLFISGLLEIIDRWWADHGCATARIPRRRFILCRCRFEQRCDFADADSRLL